MNVTTVLEEKIVLFIALGKILEREGSILPSSFYGPAISHTFLALSTQLVSSPSRE